MNTINVAGKEYTIDPTHTPVFQTWKTMWLAGSAPCVGFYTADGKNIVTVSEDRPGSCVICVEVQDAETMELVATQAFNGREFCLA